MVDRRAFFRHLLAETSALSDELGGQRQLRLGELELLPEATLHGMVPVMVESGGYFVQDRYILERKPSDLTRVVFEFADREKTILELIDGQRSIVEIAESFGLVCEDDADTALARVKGLFLTLAKNGLCRPKNPHE